MADNALVVEERIGTGKSVTRKLRAAGKIPGVLYGKGKTGRSVTLDPRALEKVLHASGSGMNTLIDLKFGGETTVVLVKELQREPIRGAYLHADLYEVDLQQTIEVSVPLHFVGKAPGVEMGGGILDHPLREVSLECLPRAIPDAIEVDVSSLELGDSIHVRDLVLPADTVMLSDLDLPVASVVAPKEEEEAAAEEELAEGEAAEGGTAAGEGDKGGDDAE
jgi:large subunit ribosomal protein L25